MQDATRSGLMRAAAAGIIAAVAAVLAAEAVAAPMPLDKRRFGVLLADQTRDQVLLTRDLNGDGDANDAGEATAYFDATNASGLASPTANVFAFHQSRDRAVYAADGDTDAVYRLRDRNRDGDANDAKEATIWFSQAGNAGGLTLPTPNGIAEDAEGAIYIVNAGVASRLADTVIRTVDLNGDGDANDAGEASVWLDLGLVSAVSSAFEIEFADGVAYIMDQNGGAPDTLWRAEDLNADGDANDAGEVTTFINDANGFGVPMGLTVAAGALGLYVTDWFDFGAGHVDTVFRLADLDGSGAIDLAAEALQVWAETALPADAIFDVGFGLAAGPGEDLMLALNSADDAGEIMVRLRDLDGDGDYLDAGETAVWGASLALGGFVDRARAVEFIARAPEPASFGLAGLGTIAFLARHRRR